MTRNHGFLLLISKDVYNDGELFGSLVDRERVLLDIQITYTNIRLNGIIYFKGHSYYSNVFPFTFIYFHLTTMCFFKIIYIYQCSSTKLKTKL